MSKVTSDIFMGSLFDVKCSEIICDYQERKRQLRQPHFASAGNPKGGRTSLEIGQAATDSLFKAMFGEQKELVISEDSIELPTHGD